jgi:SRSO17 transposase
MITGLLREVDTRNCWTLAQALGHGGPHRLQHLLSRARFDHDRAREEIANLVVRELAGQDVVLVADETGDAKSSTGCVGAGRQYSGAIKGLGLCQVAVHLAAVTDSARVVIDRALYLPKDWAADEERRDAAGVGASHTHTVTDGAGRRQSARQMIGRVLPHRWMRMRTGHGTKGRRSRGLSTGRRRSRGCSGAGGRPEH